MKPLLHVLNLPGRKPITIHVFDFGTAIMLGVRRDEIPDSEQAAWILGVFERSVKPGHKRVDVLTVSAD